MIQFDTLGAVDLRRDGTEVRSVLLQPKRLALLAYLACARPRGFHSRDALLALFWPESDTEKARNALRQALHYLRSSLGEAAVPGRGDREVGVDAAVMTCDAVAFEEALAAGRLADALDLYRGDFLPGFFVEGAPEAERWVEDERLHLRRAAVDACLRLAEAEAAGGAWRSAALRVRRAATIDPADEGVVRRLMELLAASGEAAAALEEYAQFAARLEAEYGLTPGEETRRLAERLRTRPTPAEAAGPPAFHGEQATSGPNAPELLAPLAGAESARAATDSAVAPADPVSPPRDVSHSGPAGCTCQPGACRCAQPARRPWQSALAVAALLLVIVLAGWWARLGSASAAGADPSIAVLPFLNLSGDPAQEYFSDGITEELLNALAQTPGLRVAARTSSFSFKGRDVPVDSIGRVLRVAHVLEGSVRREGNTIRVTAQLIDAATGYHVWSEQYDRPLADVLAVQHDISRHITTLLQLTLVGEGARSRGAAAVDPAAHGLVLRALQAVRTGTRAGVLTADSLYGVALAMAPDYARALAGRASVRLWLLATGALPAAEGWREAEGLAARAAALDPGLAEAHAVLGRVAEGRDLDPAAAERHFDRALELNPNDSRVLMWRALLLARQQRAPEALEAARRSAALDPLFPGSWSNLAVVFGEVAMPDSAVAALRRGLAVRPDDAILLRNLANNLSQLGRHDEAVAAVERVRRVAPEDHDPGLMVYVYARAGRGAEAAAQLRELEARPETSPRILAGLYLQAGERERAILMLERAVAEQDPGVADLRADPAWAALADARVDAILARLGG